MTDVGKSKATLSSECYKIAIQIVCVMNVPYCTSDGYIVGMYNNDICMKHLKCGEPVLGAVIIEHVCNELSGCLNPKLQDLKSYNIVFPL